MCRLVRNVPRQRSAISRGRLIDCSLEFCRIRVSEENVNGVGFAGGVGRSERALKPFRVEGRNFQQLGNATVAVHKNGHE